MKESKPNQNFLEFLDKWDPIENCLAPTETYVVLLKCQYFPRNVHSAVKMLVLPQERTQRCFRPIRGLEIILHRYTERKTDRESTYCQALLYEQRLQKDKFQRKKIGFFWPLYKRIEPLCDALTTATVWPSKALRQNSC